MIDRTCFAVLLGLLSLVCGLQCPKQRTSPGREVVCYTSVSDVDQLTEAVCKCTTLVQRGHDARNLSVSEFEGFQKSLKEISPWLQFVVSVNDPGRTLRTSGIVRQEIVARLMGVLKEVDGVELNVTAGSKERLVHFVKGLKDELVRKSYDRRVFLVLPTNSEELAKQFDLKELTKYVDLFTVPTHYLIEDDETRHTFHPSRLMGLFDMFNADSLIDLISGLGVPKRKILISVPASAYKFTLKDQDDNAPGAPTEEIQPVIVDQKELCDLMDNGEWTVERDEDLTAPYAFKDKTWIAFEDRISVSIKGKYALIRELPGLAVHDVENDFKTKCGIPLTHEVHRSFSSFKRKSRGAVLNSLEDDLHQTELEYSTKVKSSDFRVVRVVDTEGHIRVVRENTQTEFTCSRQGYFVHPKSCNRFYRCVKFNQEVEDYSVFEFDCPAGLSFDERTEVCVWPGSMPEGSPCPGSSEIAPVPRVRFECPSKSGYYADPQNPRWFFACVDLGRPEITAYEFRCPYGLIFDEQKLICEWPWLVPGYSDTYTRSEYYGTGTTAGTGGYYTGGLPYGYTGSQSGEGYTGSTVATGSGLSGAGVRGSPFGQGTGYTGSAGTGRGTSYSDQGSGAYSGTTGNGYSGIGAIDRGTSYTGQGSGVYSGTTGSGYSGAGATHGTSYTGQGSGTGYSGAGITHGTSHTGQGSGVYSGTTGSGYSGAGATHGTSYTGQGSGTGYSGAGITHGTSHTGQGSGVYSGATGSGYSGTGVTHGTSYTGQGSGTRYSGAGVTHGTSHTGQGSGVYSDATGSGYSGTGITHGTSYPGQGSGIYSGTTGSGYSGAGATHGTSFTGQGSGVYSGTTGSGYSGAGVTHGTSYTGQGSGSVYSGAGVTHGTSHTGQGSGVYSGATGSGYSGTGVTHGTSYPGQGSGIYSGTTGSGYSGAGATHGTSFTGQGSRVYSGATGSGYSGAEGTHGTSYPGQGSGIYSGTTGSGYSGAGATHGTSHTGQGSGVYSGATGSGYSGTGVTHGTSYTGQGSGSVYSGAGVTHGTSHTGQGSGVYSGATGSGYSGTGVTHGTSYPGQGSAIYSGTTGSGYSGAGATHGTSFTGQGSGVYSGTTESGYSGVGVTHGTSYTGQGSGSVYSGAGVTHGTSHTGQGSGVYSGTTGSGYFGAGGHETSGSGIYSGTTGSGHPGVGGVTHGTSYTSQGTTGSGYAGAGGATHGTSYTSQGTTGSGYSGSGADHGYSGTGTSYSGTGHYRGSQGKKYSGGTIGYTGVESTGHVGTTGSVGPGQGYTGQGFIGHDTGAGGYSATKGGSTGYAGTTSGTHIIDHIGSEGYSGSTGSPAGIDYSGAGSTGTTKHGYSGQTFGSGKSQTPVYAPSGAPGTGLEHGVTDVYSQTPRPLFEDKPQAPTCITCYGFSQPSGGQTIVTGQGATGTNVYQGATGFPGGLNTTFGSRVPSIGSATYYGGITPTDSFGVKTDTGGIVTGHGIQGSIITADSTPGTLISHGGASGTVFTSFSNQGSITTGKSHPGYTKTGPGSPGYVISDGVKTLFPGSASPGTTIYGTPAPGVVVAEIPSPGTVIKGQTSPGIVLTGQTAPGVSVGGSIVPGTVVSSSGATFAHGGLGFSTSALPFGTKIGTTPSTFDTGYKTNEYHDNGGRGTIRFNNGDVTTKYTENDIPDYRPTGGVIPPDTLLPGSKGPGAISTGFTKTGPTKTGSTTATLGAGGSYVISTGRTSPAPNPDHIGARAFEGNVAGYTKSSTESSANAYTGATSTYRPGNLGYSYPTPSIPFDTKVTKNLPISSTESGGVIAVTTPTPFLSVDIYNTPKFGEITGSPTVTSTYQRPSGFTRAPTVTSTPLLYTTGPLENYKTTVFEAAKIPVTVSTVQQVIDTGYKTVVSSTQVPVTTSGDKFGTEFKTKTSRPGGTTVFKVSSMYPVGEPQYDYGPTTSSPAIGVTYGIPFSLPGVSYQQSTPLPSGSPTNVAIGKDEVGKLVTNYNRGTTKYVSSQFDDGYAISQQNYGSSTQSPLTVTTYSAGYPRPSSLTTYQTTDKSTAVGRGKVIVKWSDLHPILLGKLGAECTCRGDPFANLRGPGSKLINSSKGKVDLSNYDDSDIYVDLEKEGSYEYQDYQVTNQESSSKQPVKIYNELSQAIGATSTQAPEKPSFTYLSSVGSRASGFTANFRTAKSLSGQESKRVAVERSVVDAPDDYSSDRSEEKDVSEEIIDGSTHCARPGLFRHPNFCNKFYACYWDEWKKRFTLHVFKCPVHLTFDKAAAACNWPSMGPACQDDNLLV